MFRVAMVLKRLVWIVAIVLVVVIAVGVALVGALTMRGFPATSGALSVPGLENDVRVTRDAAGIAWIEAETAHDLFLVRRDVVDAVGARPAELVDDEVVHEHRLRVARGAELAASVAERPDELFLLGVDARRTEPPPVPKS